MNEAEKFLETTMPRLTEAEIALINGDASQRIAMWSHNEPVTLFGAAATRTGWAEARRTFEQLGSLFSDCTAYEIDGHRVVSQACIGVALSKPSHSRPEDVVRDADRALQKAKALGKPGFQVFDSAMEGRAMSLAQLEAALRHALDREEFRTHYQPIVSVKGGKVAGFEVLLWRRSPSVPDRREPGRNGKVQ